MIYSFTGQPSAGKTTLGKLLAKYVSNPIIIDGDDLREIFDNKDYSKEGRIKNIVNAQNIAQFLDSKGYNVIFCLVSPYRDVREAFKTKMGDRITEIWVHTNDVRERDSYKVLDYEQPLENFIDVDTTAESVDDTLSKLLNSLYEVCVIHW
jgi:adenylylsulfate kinase